MFRGVTCRVGMRENPAGELEGAGAQVLRAEVGWGKCGSKSGGRSTVLWLGRGAWVPKSGDAQFRGGNTGSSK